MWVECESGELLNLDRADRVRINRDYLVAEVNEPEEWALLGTICSLKGKSEDEKKAALGHLANLMQSVSRGLVSFIEILDGLHVSDAGEQDARRTESSMHRRSF